MEMRELYKLLLFSIVILSVAHCTSPNPKPPAPIPTSTTTLKLDSLPTNIIPHLSPHSEIPNDRDPFSLHRRLGHDQHVAHPHALLYNSTEYEVGHQESFWVYDLMNIEMNEVDADLLLVTEHAYWYFADGIKPPIEILESSAKVFEESIFPNIIKYFGDLQVSGFESDTRISILHTKLQGVAGYYSSADVFPIEIYPYSNRRQIVYLNADAFSVGSRDYFGTLAHELQHMSHSMADPGEETWVNEGLSEIAKGLLGYGLDFIHYFMANPTVPLTNWPSSPKKISSLSHYGASSLFFEYLAQHYVGYDGLSGLVSQQEDGKDGISAYLHSKGHYDTFQDVFKNWLIANYLDRYDIDPYRYDGLDIAIRPSKLITNDTVHLGSVPQFAADYIEIRSETDRALISFRGTSKTPLLPVDLHGENYCWWGNRGDSIDSTLTAVVNLSTVSKATLNFWVWYNIEESWDYAYVEVSSDDGQTWDILDGKHASSSNPLGLNFGVGYTGDSRGWLRESIDLTPHTGSEILLRFEYVTDDAITKDGICFEGISIPEIGFSDDFDEDAKWISSGFVRTNNLEDQGYLVQVINLQDGATVTDVTLDSRNHGSVVIEGFTRDLNEVIIVIAGIAPRTSQPASYTLSVEPIP